MKYNSQSKQKLKEKSIEEFKRFIFYFAFFFVFFSAFIVYRRILLEQYSISYTHYGFALIESLILSKIIIIGEVLKFDRHFLNKPLIVPVLCNTIIFGFFVLFFFIIEHFLMGYIEGKSMSNLYHKLLGRHLYVILSNIFIMLFVFIPFFSLLEIGRIMGDTKLFSLFFCRREPPSN